MTQEEYRNSFQVYRNEVRKSKAHLELNVARDMRDNKNGCDSYISS